MSDQPVLSIVKKREPFCTTCKRKIPSGHKYWSKFNGQHKEHTNCDLYTKEEFKGEEGEEYEHC